MKSESVNDSFAAFDRQGRKHCGPLFLEIPFLMQCHDRDTPNATMTFIEYLGFVYGLTCRHVIDEVARTKQGQEQPALQLMIDHCVLNLGNFDASGYPHAFVRLKDDSDLTLDLAVMALPENLWVLLAERKEKVAIDLNQLSTTHPTQLRMGLAFGYLNEGAV